MTKEQKNLLLHMLNESKYFSDNIAIEVQKPEDTGSSYRVKVSQVNSKDFLVGDIIRSYPPDRYTSYFYIGKDDKVTLIIV